MNISVSDLLIFVRNQIMKAREENDEVRLKKLMIFIELFLESAYFYKDVGVASMLENFEDAIRDSFHKVEWKSSIPEKKEIKDLEDR